jgi:hypothetical protein
VRLGGVRFAFALILMGAIAGCSLLFDASNGDPAPPAPPSPSTDAESPSTPDGGGDKPIDPILDAMTDADGAGGAELAGLILHFAFEDLTGNVVKDLSGKGNDGTVLNGPTLAQGITGQGIQCDGVNDRVRVTTLDNVRFPPSGTLSFWAKPNSFAGQFIVDQYDTDRDHLFVRIRAAEDVRPNRLETTFQRAVAEPNSVVFGAFVPINVGQWVHIVIVWDTQSAQHRASFYANNTLIETQGILATWTPQGEIFELFRPGCCGSFPGVLDELRLYDRALSSTEVALVP